MAATPPVGDFGAAAPDFELPATDGRRWTLDAVRGPKGALIVFICNHCPYVKAIAGKLAFEAGELARIGIGMAAICSNDPEAYPEDGFEAMKAFAAAHGFPFPYLHDADQSVARAYGAVCTPDFFGYDAELKLQYRGRLDASGREAKPGAERELFRAMQQVAETGRAPERQTPSIGCSIKWKAA
jgi:peroxiredoxin